MVVKFSPCREGALDSGNCADGVLVMGLKNKADAASELKDDICNKF